MTGKHKNDLGVGEVVESHYSVCIAEADTVSGLLLITLGISWTSRPMYIQKITDFFFFLLLFSPPPLAEL